MRVLAVLALLLTAALSGCSGGGDKREGPATEDLSATHGTLEGLVTNDEAQPVVEAEIAIKSAKASPIKINVLTNSEGRFRLENVPAGRQTVTALHPGYDEASTQVNVVAGDSVVVRLVLVAKPLIEYKIVGLQPFEGKYTCGIEYFQASGECDFEVQNNTGQDPIPDEDHNHTFVVPAGWGGLLFEVKWTFGVQSAGVEGIRFHLDSQEDLGGRFLKVDGRSSPMRIELNQGEVAPDATLGYPIPQRGVPTWINVLPLGSADGALCSYHPPACYGAGAAINMEYSIYVTIFYGGKVDPDYKSPLQ